MKNSKVPTVLAINDISTVGRCALSVIMPVMSSLGVCVYPLPTAVLSTHTGGFGVPAKTDMTAQLEGSIAHYTKLSLAPSCIYTGYLMGVRQVEICSDLLRNVGADVLKVVDPVMADNGKLYSGFDNSMVENMRGLIKKADVILPNATEMALILGENLKESYTTSEIKIILQKLAKMSPRLVVITSVMLDGIGYANVCYNADSGTFLRANYDRIPASYPGTGDIFASVFVSALLSGRIEKIALQHATEFTRLCVATTYSYGTPSREGVLLELCLSELGSLGNSCIAEQF